MLSPNLTCDFLKIGINCYIFSHFRTLRMVFILLRQGKNFFRLIFLMFTELNIIFVDLLVCTSCFKSNSYFNPISTGFLLVVQIPKNRYIKTLLSDVGGRFLSTYPTSLRFLIPIKKICWIGLQCSA